jgi:8-oxo-dGTP pyrophosphatase MutT (NUDIX family)
VVAAVRDPAGRLLLTRCVDDNGLWVLPGGKLELGETIAGAAVREVFEETGVQVEVTGFAGIYTDPGHIIAYDDGTEPFIGVRVPATMSLRAPIGYNDRIAIGLRHSSCAARSGRLPRPLGM